MGRGQKRWCWGCGVDRLTLVEGRGGGWEVGGSDGGTGDEVDVKAWGVLH
jgi:hypothetical protein